MANKKSTEKENTATETSGKSELDTLRDIVFGSAQAKLQADLSSLEKSMLDSFKRAEDDLNKRMQDMNKMVEDGMTKLEQKLVQLDQMYDEKTEQLNQYADKLSSELEMSDANNRQENDEIHNRVDKEVSDLVAKYDAKINEALQKINKVTTELNSSKTDRKTLAKLLSTVATGLESDDE